ncbi:hypothetical protein [Krasilnikovia sp. M28-CT-15]|uniref:hypothetical protein n=1 Tax=Krasilnikovia sp. M28-CT-15 TaxID=3373540 RepID=UPI00399C9EEF
MVGVICAAPAEAALRFAFAEAEKRGAAMTVVAVGPASALEDVLVRDLVRRWTEKHPAVEVTFSVRRTVDGVVTLTAATRSCDLAIVQDGADAIAINALARRSHSPLIVVRDREPTCCREQAGSRAVRTVS